MGPDLVFHLLVLAGVVALLAVRRDYRRRRRHSRAGAPSRVNPIVRELRHLGAIVGFIVLGAHTVAPTWLGWSDLAIPVAIRWVALVGLAASVVLLFRAERHATPQVSVRRDQPRARTLVTDGPYATVRHPLYALAIAAGVMLTLLAANWVIAVIIAGILAHLLMVRLPREEAELDRAFGDTYRAYAQRTPRLVPHWRREPRRQNGEPHRGP